MKLNNWVATGLALVSGSIVAMTQFGFGPVAQTDLRVAKSAEEARPIQAGAKLPNPTVLTLDNKRETLKTVLDGKPSVIIFYRGGWCPFCNVQLSDIGRMQAEIAKKGYQIVAISPDSPSELKKTLDRNDLKYKLVSDFMAEAMKQFGVAWRAPDSYRKLLEQHSGNNQHVLPVPAVYLVNAKGEITYVYSNPDYRARLKGKDLLNVINAK